jgi:hypothetical protein
MGVAIASALAMLGWLSVVQDRHGDWAWQYGCHAMHPRGRTARRSGVEGRGSDAQR